MSITNDNIYNLVSHYINKNLTVDEQTITQNKPIGEWDVSNVTYMATLFNQYDDFNEDLNNWDVTNVTNMSSMFNNCKKFNKPLNNWNVSNVIEMTSMFNNCINFNQPLDNWNVMNVKNMSYMFNDCIKFNSPIWNNAQPTYISFIFNNAREFNQPINNWDISNIEILYGVFNNCLEFNQSLNNWNVSKVEDANSLFKSCIVFNQPLNNWNTINMKNLIGTFDTCSQFNQDINNWNVSNVILMDDTFSWCEEFNSPLENWNVSNVKSMNRMFHRCRFFNQPLENWDVSKVENMNNMFSGCEEFNQPIDKWDVSNVINMVEMFESTEKFNQPIYKWELNSNVNLRDIFHEAYGIDKDIIDKFYKFEFIKDKFKKFTDLLETFPKIDSRYAIDNTYDFFNFTTDYFKENERDNIIIKMIPKGTLLFKYFPPHLDVFDSGEYYQHKEEDVINFLLSQLFKVFYMDVVEYDINNSVFKICKSNINTRLKYFYNYPIYASKAINFGDDEVCVTYRTKRDIFVASLKSGSDIKTNYSRGAYLNPKSNIVQQCDDKLFLPGCRKGNKFDVCLNNVFYINQKVDGNSAHALNDSIFSIDYKTFETKKIIDKLTFKDEEVKNLDINNLYSNLILAFDIDKRHKKVNIKEEDVELIGLEETVLLPSGYKKFRELSDEDKVKYKYVLNNQSYNIDVSSTDITDYFLKYVKDDSPLEIISITSLFGNFIYKDEKWICETTNSKILSDYLKNIDFNDYYSNILSNSVNTKNFIDLFKELNINYNLHFHNFMSFNNMIEDDIRILNKPINMDLVVLNDAKDDLDEILKLTTINGNNIAIDLNSENEELYTKYWLTKIAQILFPELRNSILLCKYDGKLIYLNLGSNFNDYHKYIANSNMKYSNNFNTHDRFIILYEIMLNNYSSLNIYKSLDKLLDTIYNTLNLNIVDDIDDFYNFKMSFEIIARYFPRGYNNGNRIIYVNSDDFIFNPLYKVKFDEEFVDKWKNKSREIIRNEALQQGGNILSESLKDSSLDYKTINSKLSNFIPMFGDLYKDKSSSTLSKQKKIMKKSLKHNINKNRNKLHRKSIKKSAIDKKNKKVDFYLNRINKHRELWNKLLNGKNTRDIFKI